MTSFWVEIPRAAEAAFGIFCFWGTEEKGLPQRTRRSRRGRGEGERKRGRRKRRNRQDSHAKTACGAPDEERPATVGGPTKARIGAGRLQWGTWGASGCG